MPAISRGRALAYAVVLLVALTLAGRLALRTSDGGEPTEDAASSIALAVEEEPAREVVVHVAGAVVRPGLYRLPEGSRIDDAIAEAGGAKPRAALELVNLAAPLADGQQVLVPLRGSQVASVDSVGAGVPVPAGKVHLNSATLEQLDELPGIGPITTEQR